MCFRFKNIPKKHDSPSQNPIIQLISFISQLSIIGFNPGVRLGKFVCNVSDKPLFIIDLIAIILVKPSKVKYCLLLINSKADLKRIKSALFFEIKGYF
jgi:hypothetical protein